MTSEALHSKSDIAAELAYRDVTIDDLRAKAAAAENALDKAWVKISELEDELSAIRAKAVTDDKNLSDANLKISDLTSRIERVLELIGKINYEGCQPELTWVSSILIPNFYENRKSRD